MNTYVDGFKGYRSLRGADQRYIRRLLREHHIPVTRVLGVNLSNRHVAIFYKATLHGYGRHASKMIMGPRGPELCVYRKITLRKHEDFPRKIRPRKLPTLI